MPNSKTLSLKEYKIIFEYFKSQIKIKAQEEGVPLSEI